MTEQRKQLSRELRRACEMVRERIKEDNGATIPPPSSDLWLIGDAARDIVHYVRQEMRGEFAFVTSEEIIKAWLRVRKSQKPKQKEGDDASVASE